MSVALLRSALEKLSDVSTREKDSDFVWVCRRRIDARVIAAAIEQTEGEYRITHRAGRFVGELWIGPRWLVHAWGLIDAELAALQRLAPLIDPSAAGMRWDEMGECYR